MYIQPSRETKLLAKIEKEKKQERGKKKKKKKTIYTAILVLKNGGKKNTMEKFLQTIKEGGEGLRMGLVLQDKYRIYSIVRAVFVGS